jgi:hypothetical protein
MAGDSTEVQTMCLLKYYERYFYTTLWVKAVYGVRAGSFPRMKKLYAGIKLKYLFSSD